MKMYFQICFLLCFTLILLTAITPLVNCCWGSSSTNLGEMTPDQKILAGNQLQIDCSLNNNTVEIDKRVYMVNSSMITFKFDQKFISNDRIQLVNQTVARLVTKNASVSNGGTYYCMLNISSLKSRPLICLAHVTVGYKPLNVTNFKCISLYYRKLHCSWTIPHNPIQTHYYLEDKYHESLQHLSRKCGNIPSDNSCEWTVETQPPYRNTALKFNLLLTGTNQFGNNSQKFLINHYSIIKPNIPKDFKALEVTTNSISLSWKPPEFMEFDDELLENVIYEIRYFSQLSNGKKTQTVILDGILNSQQSVNLTDLVPYLKYNISIRCKTIEALSDEYWGEFSSILITTKSDVPYLAPEITSESFQTDKNMEGMRSITLFWKEVPVMYRNAPDFYYLIRYEEVVDVNVRKTRDINFVDSDTNDIKTSNTTYTFNHRKSDVSYVFSIFGANSNGISQNSSRVMIHMNDRIPHKPSDIDVYSFGGGRYEIKWEKPRINSNSGDIVNYTVFWCQNLRPRPFPCEGAIDWVVTKNTSLTLELPDIGTNYQFAVSANAANVSSGMSWAECIVPIDGRLDKLSEVRLRVHNSTTIIINWKLNCPAQRRVVEGYKIKVCRSTPASDCEKMESISVDNSAETYVMANLEPFTKYRFTVLAFSDSGPSEESDPRYETTLHDSPEDAPSGLELIDKSANDIKLIWRPPIKPNGFIIHYAIQCNEKVYILSANTCNVTHCSYDITGLESFKTYQIHVKGCISDSLCSPNSSLLTVETSVSIPDRMDPPRSEVINSTTVRILWSPPALRNGPIDFYSIRLIRSDNSTETFNISGKIREYYLTIDCMSLIDTSPSFKSQYSVQISSANILENSTLLSEFSETTNLNACLLKDGPDIPYIIGLIAGGAFGLIVLVLVLVVLVRWMRRRINSYRNLQIELPKGLEVPVLVTNQSEGTDGPPFDPFGRSDSYSNLGLGVDEADSYKNRHGSGLSQTSNSSTEPLYNTKPTDYFSRMTSNDSGHQESASSSTEAHMSSDSGVENDNQLQNKELKGVQNIRVSPKTPLPIVDEISSRNSDSSESKDSGFDANSGAIRNQKRKRKPKTTTNKANPKISSIVMPNPDRKEVTNPLYDTPMNHSVCVYSLLANSEPSLFEIPIREDDNILSDLTKFTKPEMAKSLTNIIQSYSPSDPKVNCIICENNNNSSRSSTRTSSPICPYYKYGIKRQNHNQINFVTNISPQKEKTEKVSQTTNNGYVTVDSILQNGQTVGPKAPKKRLEHDWSQNSYDAEVSSTSSNGDNEQSDVLLPQNNCFRKSLSFTDSEKIQNNLQNNTSFDDNSDNIELNPIDSSVNPLNTSSKDIVIEFKPESVAIKEINKPIETLERQQHKPSPTHLAKDSNGYVLHNALNPLSPNKIKPNLIKNSNGYVVIDAVGPRFDAGIEMTSDFVPNSNAVNNVTQV